MSTMNETYLDLELVCNYGVGHGDYMICTFVLKMSTGKRGQQVIRNFEWKKIMHKCSKGICNLV